MNRCRAGKRPAAAAAMFLAVCAASPALGQTAYFSLQGNFAAAGDKEDFNFSLSRAVSNAETMRFRTFAREGGTNAAGDVIPANAAGIDSVLELFNSSNQSRGLNDDRLGALRDSEVTWTQTLGTAMNPSPMPIGAYRLNQRSF